MKGDVCRIDGCNRIVTMAREKVCSSCVYRKHRYGSYSGKAQPKKTIEEKFWDRVNKTETCWLWTGRIMVNGYGSLWLSKNKISKSHRFSWELHNGKIPDGLCICHKCDVRHCVNPDHLFLGTVKDNIRDMDIKGRRVVASRKLNNQKVIEIKRLLENKVKDSQIAKKFNVGVSAIRHIKHNRAWRHVA